MMNAVTVRQARKYDIDGLCKLYSEFHKFHVLGVPDQLQIPPTDDSSALGARLGEILEAEGSTIFVAELDSQLIGLAEIYVREDEPDPYRISYRYAFLQSMVVSEPYRRRGIGKRLLCAANRWAMKRGASEMRLNIWEFEGGPLEFYEKQGYRTLRRTMLRRL